ncbi:MAG: peptidoglycan editing factor PgeF [Anaerolineales bacterium]|nr:peptidoglycan editing factor PgeF [Anaerolineales bacterium]MDW8227198.1 peptidoglycan editing factor PgeF [Anaerolineales bacterium]
MPFYTTEDGLRYYRFEILGDIPHAVFSRHGGVSPAPWASLNLGGTVGDDPVRVRENRRRALQALGLSEASVYDVWQVHSARVVVAQTARPAHMPHLQADAILTNQPGVTLLMRFADCVPILLYDPLHRVVGIVHAGWQGTVKRVVSEAVAHMRSIFGSQPDSLLAALGPSIGPDHYEVGEDVVQAVEHSFGSDADALLPRKNGRIFFDLWAANHLLLEQAGVRQIELAGLCTACHTEDWFSHRAEKGRTGRFGALIALDSE